MGQLVRKPMFWVSSALLPSHGAPVRWGRRAAVPFGVCACRQALKKTCVPSKRHADTPHQYARPCKHRPVGEGH
jgi:hypothetical protein